MTKLHPHARPLADWERDYIIENYPEKSFEEIAQAINTSWWYVRSRAIDLGIFKPKSRNKKEKHLKIEEINDKVKSFKIGQVYSIKENSQFPVKEDLFAQFTRIDGKRKFTGKLIDITKDLLVFHNGRYVECVRKVDFLTGDYEVIK